MSKMHNKIKLAIFGIFMIAAGLVLFFTSNSLPHKDDEVTSLDIAPIFKWLVGVPLILAGLPLSAAGFLKNIGKRAIVITVVVLISVWFLFVVSRGA
ncbi:MAG: hypothetical protein ACT4N5_00495 [Nitrosopumilaceae archaeon]